MDEELYEFAMVISVAPDCEGDWERALRSAKPADKIKMTVTSSSLAFFVVAAEQEYLAVEQAEAYLEQIARSAGVRCALNAQPSNEV